MFLKYNILGILWAVCVLPLFLLPGSDVPGVVFWGIIPFDKLVHVLIFGILVFLLIVGFVKQYDINYLRLHPTRSSIALTLAYGMIIEVVQEAFVPDRSFEVSDILANFVGCLTGGLSFNLIYYKI